MEEAAKTEKEVFHAESLAMLRNVEERANYIFSFVEQAIAPLLPLLGQAYDLAGSPYGEEYEPGILRWLLEQCEKNGFYGLELTLAISKAEEITSLGLDREVKPGLDDSCGR